MTELIAGGALGLLLGAAIHRCGLSNRHDVAAAIALRRRNLTRRVLLMIGWATVLTAFLAWLAVIDVDRLTVVPLHGGTVLGGLVFGAAAALTGLMPGTVPAVAGGGRFLEGMCGAAGCVIGVLLLPKLQPVIQRVQEWGPGLGSTLFRVTLDEPYLWSGGFLGQGCVGAAMMALALIIPAEPETVDVLAAIQSAPESPEPESTEPPATEAEEVQADTVAALPPGEDELPADMAEAEADGEASGEKEKSSADDAAEEERLG